MIATQASIGFALGLAGSLHCLGMCGPMAMAAGVTGNSRFYHLGRLITYSTLGALAAIAGSLLSHLTHYQQTATLLAGLLMLIVALVGPVSDRSNANLTQIQRKTASFLTSSFWTHKLTFGLAMGLLPCGMIYTALLAAAATTQPLAGAVTLASFWAATTIPLVFASTLAPTSLRKWAPTLTPLAMAILGLILVWRGLAPVTSAPNVHHH